MTRNYLKQLLLPLSAIFICALAGCQKVDNRSSPICWEPVIVSAEEFAKPVEQTVTINAMEITNDCLRINVSASGCNGKTWKLTLIDSGNITDTEPLQRKIKLRLTSTELCEAYLTKEASFDIRKLKRGKGPVLLVFENAGKQLLYYYQ